MNFYIPNIGDLIQLTESWKFPLYAESRNKELAKHMGFDYTHYGIFTKSENIEAVKLIKHPQVNPNDFYDKFPDGRVNFTIFDRPGFNIAQAAARHFYNIQLARYGEKVLNVELPAGSVLSIDRIYIKKTSTDFNSITFYVRNLKELEAIARGEKPKKGKMMRFWAKLPDCNNIQFEKVEKKVKKNELL